MVVGRRKRDGGVQKGLRTFDLSHHKLLNWLGGAKTPMTVKNSPGGCLNEEVCVARITKETVTEDIWILGSRQYR